MDISLVRLKRLKKEQWPIFIPKYPFFLSVQTTKEDWCLKNRVQTCICVQLLRFNVFLNVVEVKTSQALMLCLLHMKASSFLCHFHQKEPIGFPLKTFYWLVHMVYVFLKGSLVYLGKEWEFNHTPLWAGAGAAGDSRQPRHVGSGLTRVCPWNTKKPQWHWLNSATQAGTSKTFSALTTTAADSRYQISHECLSRFQKEPLSPPIPPRWLFWLAATYNKWV